ncbi:MAG: TolC family outer membrane protein [Rhodospirillales bacterium]
MIRLAFLLGMVVATMASAGSASAQSLVEALSAAYIGNPVLDRERATLRATDERVPQALSGWRPRIDAFGEIGKRTIDDNNRTAIQGNSNLTPEGVGLAVRQPLFRGGRTFAQTRSAENRVRSGREDLRSTEQDILFDAARAFLDVFRAQAVLDLRIQNEQRLTRQLEATRDRFQVGEVTRTDVFQAEARLADATAQRVAAEGDLDSARALYRNVVGETPGDLQRPALPWEIPTSLEETIDRALDGDPDLLAARFAERAAQDDIDDARGELLPEINLIGRAERERETGRQGARFNTYEALVRMDLPLYQAGTAYSRLRQTRQTAAAARRNVDSFQRRAVQRATQAWTDYETARAQIVSFTKSVEANTVALEGVQNENLVGARTVLDVLDAENELLNSQVGLVTAQRDEGVAIFELLDATGRLSAAGLDLPVEVYDPGKHYTEVRGKWFGGTGTGGVTHGSADPRGAD